MGRLCSDSPDRFLGTRGHRRACAYIVDVLRRCGREVRVHPFTVDMTVPSRWSLEIAFGRGFETVEARPGLGSPSVRKLTADIVPVGYAREEDYDSQSITAGTAHLAKLWKSHETRKVSEAAIHGASSLIWYNEYFDELYSGACDYSQAPIPGVSIRKSVAQRLNEAGGGRIRLSVKSRRKRFRCRNIESGTQGDSYLILTAHHDSRPYTPGASDDASGVSVMLTFLEQRLDRDLPLPVRFLFADCEEEGCVGAEHHAMTLYQANLLRHVAAVVNLDAVGWPNLCLITRDREAVMDEGLTELASDVLRGAGYEAERVRSKSGKSNHTPFANRGVRTLWFSDYPNYIRHSAIDNTFNIDYPTMARVTRALREVFLRMG